MPEIKYEEVGSVYQTLEEHIYYSKRYNRYITLEKGFPSDGATGAPDVDTDAWWVHDKICATGKWDDGTPIDNWTASTVMADILWRDGHEARSVYWWFATYLFGGGEARKNGMRRVNLI